MLRLAVLACLLLSLVSGCSSVAVWLGLRVRLDKIPVTRLSVSMVDKHSAAMSALGPGQKARLVIVATARDGKQYTTVGGGKGKVAFDNYTIQVTIVQLGKKGAVSLSADPRVSEGKVGHVHVTPVAHPEVSGDFDIPVRYDIPFVANYSGADGAAGIDGTNGLDGTDGTDGSPAPVDPTTGLSSGTQGPGGAGTNGNNGTDGSDGQDGAPGLDAHVWIRVEQGTKPLLQVKVDGGGRESFFLVDPAGGTLKILANGGAGGRGGSGGRGGRGGRGGQGFPPGTDGFDGQPGSDGRPGRDGAAGTIAITVDPVAQSYMSCVSWSNHSGRGSAGLAPIISVAPVPALW